MAKKYYAVRAGKLTGIFLDWENCSMATKGVPGAEYKGFSDISDAERYLRGEDPQQIKDTPPEVREQIPENQAGDRCPEVLERIPRNQVTSLGTEFPERTSEKQGEARQGRSPESCSERQTVIPEIGEPGGSSGGRSKEEACGDSAYAFVDGSFNSMTHVYGYGGFLVDRGEEIILQGSGDEPEMASMRNVAGEILGSMAAVEEALRRGLAELTIYYDYMGIEMWATGRWKRNKEGTIRYHEYMRSAMEKIRIRFVKVRGHSGIDGNERADRLAKEATSLVRAVGRS